MSLPALMATTALRAQDTTAQQDSSTRHGTSGDGATWIIGASAGLLTTGLSYEDGVGTLGVHFTQFQPGHPGLDVSLGVAPRGLQYGILLGGVRGGVTFPLVPTPGLVLLPTAGVSLLGAAGDHRAAGVIGYNVGGAAILGDGDLRLRTSVTWHRMQDTSRGTWLIELGFVHFPTPAPENPLASRT